MVWSPSLSVQTDANVPVTHKVSDLNGIDRLGGKTRVVFDLMLDRCSVPRPDSDLRRHFPGVGLSHRSHRLDDIVVRSPQIVSIQTQDDGRHEERRALVTIGVRMRHGDPERIPPCSWS
jgi:hypothetical protein